MKRILLLSTVFFNIVTQGYGQAGNLDASFGTNGIVKTDAGAQAVYGFISQVTKILLANDGSIFNVISTSYGRTVISKRHSDGSVDLTYRNKGFSDLAFLNGNDAVMQPDGKIVVVGYTKILRADFAIARYNTDGSLDKTFSSDGYQSTVFGPTNSIANSVALQSDGKIVVGGILGGFNGGDFVLVRFNSNGSLDNSFSSDGKQTTSFGNPSSTLRSVVIQNDGKIVAAGFTSFDAGDSHIFALARYNNNGNLDNSFSNDGKQTTRLGGGNYITTAAIQANGKIVVAGFVFIEENDRFEGCVARYNTNGSLDKTFSGDGSVITDYGPHYDLSQTIALQSDGKIVMAHSISTDNKSDFAVSRYTTTGSLDKTFSGNGIQVTDFNHGQDFERAVAIQKDGKIIVGGETTDPEADPALCRYKTDGTPDNSFGTNGKVMYSFRHGNTEFRATTVQKDGKVVTAGTTWNGDNFDFVVARYNTNGTPDHSFSGDGITTTSFGPGNDFAYAVAIQNDGKIVLAGSHSNGLINAFAIARYNTDGTPDKSFDEDGQKTIVFGPDFDNYATSLLIQKNGKIVAGGVYNQKSALIRLNLSGTLDKTFSDNGKQLADFPESSFGSIINSIALQSDGKIITAGGTLFNGNVFNLARFNTDGTLDESFGDHGKATGDFNSGTSVAIQGDDKIVLGGFKVSRFTRDGKPDLTFNGTGTVSVNSFITHSIAIDHNGKIFAGGSNESHSSVTAINSNGTPDDSFGDNGTKTVPVGLTGSENTLLPDLIFGIAIFNDKLYSAGAASDPGRVGTLLKFSLGSSNVLPAIALNKINSIVTPGINNVALSLRLFPNPVHDILNVYTDGLQENKRQTISIISASGVIIRWLSDQTKQAGISSGAIPLNVSSLARGTYIIKIVSGEKVIYKQFVKM